MLSENPHDQLSTQTRFSTLPQQAPQQAAVRHTITDPGIDLTQLWGTVRDNQKLVFSVGALVFVAAMAHCLTAHMTFRSVARMYMGESDRRGLTGDNIDMSTGSSEASSEQEVFRSRAMVRKGVLGSGYNVYLTPPEWEPPVFWQWLLSRRDPSLLDVASAGVIATNTALADGVVQGLYYRVRFLNKNDYVLTSEESVEHRGELGKPLQLQEASITLLPGAQELSAGVEFDLYIEPTEDAVDRALGSLSVSVPKSFGDPARVLTLEFVSPNRRLAASFLDHLMKGYLETRLDWKTEDAAAAEAFVTDQLHSFRQSLDQTLGKLADFRTEHSVVVSESQAQAASQQLNKYEEQRIAAQLELNALRQIQKAIQNPKMPIEAFMVGEATDTVLQRMAASLAEAREKLSVSKAEFADSAPDVKRQEAVVQAQLASIRQYVNGRASRAEKQLGALNAVIGQSEDRLKTVPGAELALAQMGRETEVYTRMYSNLLERKQQAAISKASTVSKNRILDRSYVPIYEDSPKLGLHLASGILGLLLGAVIAVLRGFFSGIFRRENDVRGALGPVQLVARIPTRWRTRPDDSKANIPVFDVLGGRVDPAFTEAFRALRTNLYRALPGEHGKVIAVTSPGAGDGKTTCALGMAAMLAADHRRVLVIDADTRNPSHHTLFGIPEGPGLREVVTQDQRYWRDSIRTLCVSSGSFDSLCAGSGASAEHLSDPQFVSFLLNARSQYDFVIIDAPSYPTVSDPLVLAPLSDFVLSVVRLGATPRRLAEEHASGIMAHARGYGVAVNNVEASPQAIKGQSVAPRLAGAFRRLR